MKKFAARFLLIAAIVLIAIFAFLSFGVYSEGTRAGQVIKVSKKGVVFKTWEGQLNMQSFGAIKSNNTMAEVFDFSITKGDTSIYNLLENVSLTGERVNLHYKEKFAKLPWNGDSKFFVIKIDRLPKEDKKPVQNDDPYRENR